jgi:hypothetical protein
MSDDAQEQSGHAFESVISTLLSCGNMLRIQGQLSMSEREEILARIEQAVLLLRSWEPREAGRGARSAVRTASSKSSQDQYTLRALYQLYQVHVSSAQANAQVLTGRFNEALRTLTELQTALQECSDFYLDQHHTGQALQRVGAFIADLYCLFMEFRRSLSTILEEQSSYINTEELSSLQRQHSRTLSEQARQEESTASSAGIEEQHWQLDQRRQAITRALGDAAAFVVLLEDGLRSDLSKRNEVIAHLHRLAQLLSEAGALLTDYEATLRNLL